MNFQINMVLALILLIVSVKLFVDHRSKDYSGNWRFNTPYATVSSTKHDITKVCFTMLFPLLVYGVPAGEKFFDPDNFLDSQLGHIFVILTGWFTYHELVLPYIVARMPPW